MKFLRKIFHRKKKEVKITEEVKIMKEERKLYPSLPKLESKLYPDLSGFYLADPEAARNYWRYLYLCEINRK